MRGQRSLCDASFKDEAMTRMRSITRPSFARAALAAAALPFAGLGLVLTGCSSRPPPYGTEQVLAVPHGRKAVWAVAPAVNLSGQREVDPLLQADLLYQQVQQVRGLTVVPVNRVAEVYAGLGIGQVQSAEQAALVCDLLGCDALLVPTVSAYDPYDPPKLGASLQLFGRPAARRVKNNVNPRELARLAAPGDDEALPASASPTQFLQVVGMFDAANGSVREALWRYARGRHDPVGPMGRREYLMSMDRYVGFAYHALITDLLRSIERSQLAVKQG